MNTKNDNFETLICDENGQAIEVLIRKEDGSAWLTRKETANLFSISLRTLSRCISTADSVGDKTISVGDKNASVGDKNASVGKEFLLTAADGKNDKTKLFDLTTVMAIGFRRKTGIVTKLPSWIRDSTRIKPPEKSFVIIYDNGEVNLDVRFTPEGDDVWLTQNQMATLFETTQPNISAHIKNIHEDKELDAGATHKYFLLVHPNSQVFLASSTFGRNPKNTETK